MKYILLICIVVLTGCKTNECPEAVRVPVFTPPNVEMPKRPVLVSNDKSNHDITTKNAEKDLIDLSNYASQLEDVLDKILNHSK